MKRGNHQKSDQLSADNICPNCEKIALEDFCGHCGQNQHIHRSMGHFFEELVHGVTHLDGRVLRSLPMLLFRPGTLTHAYIHGKRTHYLTPFSMFLGAIFLMFFVFSHMGHDTGAPEHVAAPPAPQSQEVDGSGARYGAPTGTQLSTGGHAVVLANGDSEFNLNVQRDGLEGVVYLMKTMLDDPKTSVQPAWLKPLLQERLANPELFIYQLNNAAYKYSFLLVPISLPFLWLMFFWRRGVTLYDHTVFALYSLSFMSLWFLAVQLLSHYWPKNADGDSVVGWLMLLPIIHIFFQFKGAYGLGKWGAFWRTSLFVCLFGWVCLATFLTSIALMGLLA